MANKFLSQKALFDIQNEVLSMSNVLVRTVGANIYILHLFAFQRVFGIHRML